jgi:Asp-tRNA(Asn)/Glu-tRNA(Gln) amidotransferase A subunit family amidase
VDDLLALDLRTQAALVRSGDVSAVELCRAVLDRIDAVDARLGSMMTVDADGALGAAEAADRAPAESRGPLHGVPITIKDLARTKGLRTTYGSALFADHVPDSDAPAVRRLREAGAVIVGKANTPEFGLAAETYTRVGPRCANPWDLERTSGGSSGGSAAAVAAGIGAMSLGSDAGGSIRLPAGWCGVVGLKPTYGRVPSGRPTAPADHPMETTGPITRTIADAALTLDLIAGHDPEDPASLDVAPPACLAALDGIDAPVRVRFGIDLGMGPVDASVEHALNAAMTAWSAAGARVEPSTLRTGEPHPFFLMFDLVAGTTAARLEPMLGRKDELAEYTQAFLDTGLVLSAADHARAVYQAKSLRARVDAELRECDVLALPVTATVAWRHGTMPDEVGGRPMAAHGGIAYGGIPHLALANVTGHPAVTLPCGLDADGLPIGVQLIGRSFGEAGLLRAAAQLESVLGFSARPAL